MFKPKYIITMKRNPILALVALTIMMALPAQAQYGRYGNPRGYGHTRVTPSTRSGAGYYTYYGFRLGLAGGTINADNPFYDAGGIRSGLNAV